MSASTIQPRQTAYVGEVWIVGVDFRLWEPSTITPVSNVVTARDEAGADVTGTVISNALVSGTKSVATFSNFSTGKTYDILVATTMSNSELVKHKLQIVTETL